MSSEFAAQNYVDGKYSSGSAYGNSATLPKIPITVGSSINLYNAKIKVDVADPANPGSLLCRTDVLLGSKTLTVTANTDTAASYEVTVGVSNCSRGLQGVIQYLGAPPEATFQYGYVQTYGPGYVYQQISSADTTYKIDGLAVGDWYMSVVMYFGSNWGNYLQFPNQNPSKVTLLADSGMVTRDFIFNSTKATGSVDVTGVWACRLSNGSVNFNGSYDSTQTNGGPSYGGYASAQVTGSTGAYTAYLTPGKWSSNYASLSFSENQPGQVPVSSTMYVYKTYDAFDSTTTATATGPTITVPTSETSIVFDVIEQPGEADINIQYANINGSRYDSATGTNYQIYANSQWNLQPTHTVRVVGVPGTYNITATGQVNGSTTSLSTFSITLPIDNCATNGGGCSADATCAKTGPGTHTCTCNSGFEGDGVTCTVSCQPSDCEDNNVCTTESCNSAGECVHSNNDGASCSDGSACTSGDLCAAGSCAGGSAVVCEDNNACTVDSCDPASGCVNATGPDGDGDGTLDCTDNCVAVANADQANLDSDGQGDACDGDDDNDGAPDAGNPNCTATLYSGTNFGGVSQTFGAGVHDFPAIFKVGNDATQSIKVSGVKLVELWQHYTPYNGQTFTGAHATFTADDANANDNGIGGVSSLYVVCPIGDNCPVNANADQLDTDKDGQGDACDSDDDNDGVADGSDNCPLVVNADQADNESDGKGDACDADDDNDGVVDSSDNCPMVSNEDQANNGDDALGNVCDDDDDNDGVVDLSDNCAFAANAGQTDTDADGQGDACDGDDDNDGIADEADNCVTAANVDQADLTGDGEGDACDADDDDDGVADTSDNCPVTSNAGQADQDADDIGDLCDLDIDGDNDGVADSGDNCQFTANGNQANNDGDTQGDLCDDDDDNDTVADGADNCAFTANSNQQNTDGDQLGDACDPDLDGDGVANVLDNCLSTVNGDQADLDGDGQGDACDGDIDGDSVANGLDNCPVAANGTQIDQDADGLGDACDPDIDGDGVANNNDNCWMTANSDQINTDGDSQGDACDADDDNDGVLDGADNCQLVANSTQVNFDGDSQGDACDADDDNDGVLDGSDVCASTPLGTLVTPSNGCSVNQQCPCSGPRGTTTAWKNHGQYVSCVAQATNTLVSLSLLTGEQKGVIQSTAAQSTCGGTK